MFRHIILVNNENKSITNSRDTQEVFLAEGIQFLKIFHSFKLKTSILDDFIHYQKEEEQQSAIKANAVPTPDGEGTSIIGSTVVGNVTAGGIFFCCLFVSLMFVGDVSLEPDNQLQDMVLNLQNLSV